MGSGILGDCMKPATLEAMQAQLIAISTALDATIAVQRTVIENQMEMITILEETLGIIVPSHIHGKKINRK